MRAMDLPIYWMILFETSHALRLGSDKTKVKSGMFQRRVFAQFRPILPNRILIEFADFAERNSDLFDARDTCLFDDLVKDCFCGLLFTHG